MTENDSGGHAGNRLTFPRTKRILILVLAFDAVVVTAVVLYFLLRR